VLALLRFRGLLNPVKHPAARLDCRGGSNPRTSHKALEFGLRCRPRQHAAQLSYRVFYSTVGAVDSLSLFDRTISRYPCWLALAGIPPLTGVSLSSPAYTGFPFGTVGSMTTCQVLRCQEQGTAVYAVFDEPLLEALVCARHKEKMDAGEPWSIPDDPGVIHMGTDIAPKLVTWTATDQAGSPSGFTLNMELDADGQPRSQSIWVSETEAQELLKYLQMFWSPRD
jgi:hypothetical protein